MWYGWIIWQAQTKWEKAAVLKYRQCRGPSDILNFPLVFSVSGDFVKPAQAVCFPFYDDTCFSFSWSQTSERVSYESAIATSATNLLPLLINMRLTSTPRSMIHRRQTALPAVFPLFFLKSCASPYPRALILFCLEKDRIAFFSKLNNTRDMKSHSFIWEF